MTREADRLLKRCQDQIGHLGSFERGSVELIAGLRKKLGYITFDDERTLSRISELLPDQDDFVVPDVPDVPGVP
jgi:hypothetical protein